MTDKREDREAFRAEVIEIRRRLRDGNLRIHCLTNAVAQELTANVLLALGCQPSMTTSPDEVEEFVASAHALLVNLGTLDAERREAMPLAILTAKARSLPWVLDPVFVERSSERRLVFEELLSLEGGPDAVRANIAEARTLQLTADQRVVVQTGASDRIRQGVYQTDLELGHPFMGYVTGMGCALGGVMAACLAASDDPFIACTAAVLIFGVAGYGVGSKAQGPGSFVPLFLDALHALDDEQLVGGLDFEMRAQGAG